MLNKGRFISLEGVEGVGKSTAMAYIQNQLDAVGIKYVVTREPGGTPIAEDVRQILLGDYEEFMSPDTELLLFFAARAQNIAQIILPALQRGQWVIADRFVDASYAYQGGGRGVSTKHITELTQWVVGDLAPDLTLLLDAPVATGIGRIKKRGVKDRIEKEGVGFFERVRQRYLQRAEKFPERFCIINADKEIQQVEQQIKTVIDTFINRHNVA